MSFIEITFAAGAIATLSAIALPQLTAPLKTSADTVPATPLAATSNDTGAPPAVSSLTPSGVTCGGSAASVNGVSVTQS